MAITKRLVKGSALTHTELDANFTDLDGRATANAAQIVVNTRPNTVFVTQANAATTLGGTIDSTVEYIITGIINMAGIVITVPTGGIYIRGYNFDVSQLTSSEASATLFSSAASGNILMFDIGITMSGASSKVYDLVGNTGFEAIEVLRINYTDCTSLGEIDTFRQGLETGTGRFGGTPALTLTGTWVGGFVVTTSITRNLTAGTYDLFVSGAAFSMASRFFSDMNVDLPAGVGFTDFSASAFPNPNTFQINGMIITRAGANDSDDALYFPNISPTDIAARFRDNVGLNNTHDGGVLTVSTAAVTTIVTDGVAVELTAPTWAASDMDHFSEVSNGRFKHLGAAPTAYRIHLDVTADCTAGNILCLEFWKYDASATTDTKIYSALREVRNFTGGADSASFASEFYATLDINDQLYMKVANIGATNDVTVELGSAILVAAR